MAFVVNVPGSSSMTQLTFGEAKRRVARVTGARSNPDEHGAGEAIEQVIDEFNNYCWKYLGVRGDDITIYDNTTRTAGQEGYQGLYTLPAPMKKNISLKLTGTPNRKLTYISQETWDELVRSNVGGTYYYTDLLLGQNGYVQLLDWPTGAGTMEVRYYRPIAKPSSDDTPLDFPRYGILIPALIQRAKAIIALDRGVFANRIGEYQRLADRFLMQAIGDDMLTHDGVPQILSYEQWAKGLEVNPNSPDWWNYWGY